ncbi:MAG: hypothetical protein R3303_06270 [Marinobacter sp.]|nr:hypothetical protein [Marinobacter sp.]
MNAISLLVSADAWQSDLAPDIGIRSNTPTRRCLAGAIKLRGVTLPMATITASR